jgi:hypothetical protein
MHHRALEMGAMERTLGQALVEEIETRAISRAEAARLMGTSGANVTRWITGVQVPSPLHHRPLQEFLRVDRAELALLILSSDEQLWEWKHRK